MLKEFKGYLQTDGCAVYDQFYRRDGIAMVHCMAHARRYFKEAQDNDKERSSYALKLFQEVYQIERNINNLRQNKILLIKTAKKYLVNQLIGNCSGYIVIGIILFGISYFMNFAIENSISLVVSILLITCPTITLVTNLVKNCQLFVC